MRNVRLYCRSNIRGSVFLLLKNFDFDVCVVGASLAGASAAIQLANSGLKVAVVDKANFPRAKVCGEGLSLRSFSYLKKLNILDAVTSGEYLPYSRYDICLIGTCLSTNSVQNSSIAGIGIERYVLDNLLIKRLLNCRHTEFFFGAAVKQIDTDDKICLLKLSDGTDITSRFVILADGARSNIANKLKIPTSQGIARWGLRSYYQGHFSKLPNAVSVFPLGNCEVFLTPVSKNKLNACILAKKESVSSFSSEKDFHQIVKGLLPRINFSDEQRSEVSAIGPVTPQQRKAYHNNILLIGDACETLDPIGGMGMSHAFASAHFAANALEEIFFKENAIDSALATYAAEREKFIRPLRGFTRITQLLLRKLNNEFILKKLFQSKIPTAVHHAVISDVSKNSIAKNLVTLSGM